MKIAGKSGASINMHLIISAWVRNKNRKWFLTMFL